ncbi:Hypothetical Protein FCC1311_009122 [Hondaea fermentalgiana]|uniref:CCHC-type domain-containing protein n=1 Tax=Hondaea fermentalgiana TaxID=2315210 RepID=A0A2R5GAH3_9STRA|nr:Hypothetical Protein FCC1311_009122 [Hondaea fermentalgiana]|eukprot:GBG24694.1 Hypothetical Protein FCC1311_009122 [Hondaea fermentalgiana]
MGKTRARGKSAEGGGKMAASGSGSGNIMDMFHSRKRTRTNEAARKKEVTTSAAASGQRTSSALKTLRKEKVKQEEPAVPATKKSQKKQHKVVETKDKDLDVGIVDLSAPSTSAVDLEPEVDVDSFPYRADLKKIEEAERGREDLPFSTYLTVHYEPRGVSEDSLQREYGRSPRDIFNTNVNNCKVTQYVLDTHVVPDDFDRSSKYGPRSGVCFEERLVSAYEQGLLAPKDPAKPPVKMCRECGTSGHFCWECPSLVA